MQAEREMLSEMSQHVCNEGGRISILNYTLKNGASNKLSTSAQHS